MKLKLLTLGALMAFIAPSLAQTNANPAMVSGARIEFASTNFDFGQVYSDTMVKHEFIFTNTGNQPLEVSWVRWVGDFRTDGEWSKRVEPGHTGKIPVVFNTIGSGNVGEVHKTIIVECNDSIRSNVTLHLQATVCKAFDVSPVIVHFSLGPDQQGIVTQSLKIINTTDQPAKVSEPTCTNKDFKVEIKTVVEGKEFELQIAVDASRISGSIATAITMKTSLPKMLQLRVPVIVTMQPILVASPREITLPTGPLPKEAQVTVMIQNKGSNPVTLFEPSVNADGVTAQVAEQQPGRQFTLTVNFPAGFQGQSGDKVTVKSSSANRPGISIPVFQPLPPSAIIKSVIDKESGQYAITDSTRKIVSLCDKNGKVLWSTNLVAGLAWFPEEGEPKIWAIRSYKNNLVAQVGKTWVRIDKKTGEVRRLGDNYAY